MISFDEAAAEYFKLYRHLIDNLGFDKADALDHVSDIMTDGPVQDDE